MPSTRTTATKILQLLLPFHTWACRKYIDNLNGNLVAAVIHFYVTTINDKQAFFCKCLICVHSVFRACSTFPLLLLYILWFSIFFFFSRPLSLSCSVIVIPLFSLLPCNHFTNLDFIKSNYFVCCALCHCRASWNVNWTSPCTFTQTYVSNNNCFGGVLTPTMGTKIASTQECRYDVPLKTENTRSEWNRII